LILLISVSSVFCQVTKICGVVKSKNTQECIPFASVTFINSNIGTISDFNGEFVLETKSATDSLLFSSIGYKKKVYPVKKEVFQSLTVELEPENYSIAEVVITPGANPAHALLEKAIKHKSIHHPKNIDSYQCEIYNKIQIDINNVDEKFRDRKVFNQFQFIFEHIDTSSLSGKPYLPVLLTETISDYYYSGENDVEHEVIKANKISGTENKSLSEFTGKMYQKLEIYDNFITVFEPGFVSPIADFGLMYYKYYLVDSLNHQGHWCYKISFEPKRKNERTFSGYFMIADTSYAVVKAQLRISEGANINFINDYMATLAFNEISDSTWFLTKEKHIVDFNLTDKSLGFFGRKSTSYNNIMMNRPIPEKILKSKTDITLVHNVIDREKAFWEEHRHEALTEKEENIYEMVDSIKNVPVFNTFEDIMFLLTNYYYILGPFEYGPYYKTYSNNYIEGHRVRLGGRTSNAFSTRLMLNGHVAYGFKDEKFKYGFGALYMFSKNPRISAGFQYLNDCKQLGQSDNAFSEDNFLTSLLRRSPNKTLTMVEEQRWFIEREWFQGFSNKLTFRHENIHPVEAIPFQTMNNDNEPTELAYISNSELSLNTRFAKDEKFISGEFTRISLGTKSPIFELNLSVGSKHILKGDFDYLKIQASIKDKVEINPFGYLRYSIDAGKFFGTLPFPLLELHQGNETYAHDHLSFNMMNYYEFVSDRYVSLWTEHHFQGFFLNHIPLIRKLHWREVISARGVMGALNDKHQHILHFPNGLSSLSKPYYEAGFGIENILKLFRIDALWRLTYLDNPDIEPFGIRLKIQVIL
jgi:hypothetical protein